MDLGTARAAAITASRASPDMFVVDGRYVFSDVDDDGSVIYYFYDDDA